VKDSQCDSIKKDPNDVSTSTSAGGSLPCEWMESLIDLSSVLLLKYKGVIN
jgi:hypothetical protein